jgi:6-phosphogluconolactonase (cycloisomerase 2 family)
VYTANGGSDDVSALKENLTTGALSPATGSPFHAGSINENVPGVLTVDPSGRFLYVGDADSAEISTFTINRDTGVLTEVAGSPFPSARALQFILLVSSCTPRISIRAAYQPSILTLVREG